MQIQRSTTTDIDGIFKLYDIAVAYQKERFHLHWPSFDRSMVEAEIADGNQWKIVADDGSVACVFATAFDDPLIWREKNTDPAVYIHRIATNPDWRGQNFVAHIIEWAKKYAAENGKNFLRLDTVGDNKKLTEHYVKSGFHFLGIVQLTDTAALPSHYHNAAVSLFELPLPAVGV